MPSVTLAHYKAGLSADDWGIHFSKASEGLPKANARQVTDFSGFSVTWRAFLLNDYWRRKKFSGGSRPARLRLLSDLAPPAFPPSPATARCTSSTGYDQSGDHRASASDGYTGQDWMQ